MRSFWSDGKDIYEAIVFDNFPKLLKSRPLPQYSINLGGEYWDRQWRAYPVLRRSDDHYLIDATNATPNVVELHRHQVLLVRVDVGVEAPQRPVFKVHDVARLSLDFVNVPVAESSVGMIRQVQKVSRNQIKQAMACSGFDKIKHCCPAELQKHCGGDEYKGNLEGFVAALMEVLAKAE